MKNFQIKKKLLSKEKKSLIKIYYSKSFLYLTFPIVNVATKPNPNSANTKLKSSSAPVLGSSPLVTVVSSCKLVALNEFERLGLLDTLEIKVETFASFEGKFESLKLFSFISEVYELFEVRLEPFLSLDCKFGLVNILEGVVEPSDSAEAKIA